MSLCKPEYDTTRASLWPAALLGVQSTSIALLHVTIPDINSYKRCNRVRAHTGDAS